MIPSCLTAYVSQGLLILQLFNVIKTQTRMPTIMLNKNVEYQPAGDLNFTKRVLNTFNL